jgi:hypothetical protein
VDYLRGHFAPGESGAEAADLLLRSRIAPSKQLLAPVLAVWDTPQTHIERDNTRLTWWTWTFGQHASPLA